MSHVKSDTSLADSEAGDEQSFNEMTMDVVDLENGLRGKDFSDTFMEFLKTELSDENLEFYIEVQNFKKIVMPADIHTESKRIFDLYIDDNCEKQINIDSNARQAVNKLMSYPNSNMFDACEEQILNLMKSDCYPRFLQSDLYKKNSKNLPSFSRRNKLLIPYVKDGKIISNVSSDLKINKSTSNISIGSIDIKERASLPLRDKHKMIVMPILEESVLDVKTSVKPNSIRIIFHKRNYILSPKDGQTFKDLLAFLNISNKELASYYGFLLPSQKIIELSQNPVYYLKNTIDLRRFSLINFAINNQIYAVKCPYEYEASTAVNSLMSVLNIRGNQVESIKLKNKKSYTPDAISGKYDRITLTVTLIS